MLTYNHHRFMKILLNKGHSRWRQRAGALSVAESYPISEVWDSGPECQAAMVQERPGGATPRPRRSGAAGRRHPTSEVKVAARRSLLTPEARGSDPEEPP